MNNFVVITLSLLLSVVLTITTFPLGHFAPDWIHLFLDILDLSYTLDQLDYLLHG